MATPGASRQNGLTSTAKAVSLREKRVAIKNDSAKKAEPFFRRKSAEGTLKNQSALCIQQHRAARSTPVPTHQSRVAKKGESEGELRPSQTLRYLPPQYPSQTSRSSPSGFGLVSQIPRNKHRNFKCQSILKRPQIQSKPFLYLFKTIHQRIPMHIQLPGRFR